MMKYFAKFTSNNCLNLRLSIFSNDIFSLIAIASQPLKENINKSTYLINIIRE